MTTIRALIGALFIAGAGLGLGCVAQVDPDPVPASNGSASADPGAEHTGEAQQALGGYCTKGGSCVTNCERAHCGNDPFCVHNCTCCCNGTPGVTCFYE
jgi:hypothetical protein